LTTISIPHARSLPSLLQDVPDIHSTHSLGVLDRPKTSPGLEQLRAYCHGYFQFARERSGIFRVMFMTTIREGVPVPVRGGPVGEDEGVDSFNDFLAIVTRCLPGHADAFTQAAYLGAGLHGRVALSDAIPTFPWPPEPEYIDRMIDLHVTNA
jgi:Tetracyclin repressor-like, C-terminal domain